MAALTHDAPGTRFLYVLPNFQNPSGRLMPEDRREALVAAAKQAGVPLVEDNPYGDLWFDAAPPRPLAARWPEGTIYLGLFSKVLAPQAGLRGGAARSTRNCCRPGRRPAHAPGFNQRVVHG